MNREEIITALRTQSHQIRRLSERQDATETTQNDLVDLHNRTQAQTNNAIRHLVQLIQGRL